MLAVVHILKDERMVIIGVAAGWPAVQPVVTNKYELSIHMYTCEHILCIFICLYVFINMYCGYIYCSFYVLSHSGNEIYVYRVPVSAL